MKQFKDASKGLSCMCLGERKVTSGQSFLGSSSVVSAVIRNGIKKQEQS